ncbi:hypothetical protein MF672_031580 [Actinomadura sp. ATCC 31491]|uniref:Uncharacterized protein n=1 Tax=Actinomadura luzonensis TaxID=2805427 RepID=A0ABT0G124_9ACTN|nr:hypothetical protein [Actinomadura luzonensis]MCK2218299.1 hypothetical protein [Actinomadura luzonensis]
MRRATAGLALAATAVVGAVCPPAAPTPAHAADRPYRIEVINHSGFGLDEVRVAYTTRSDPAVRMLGQRRVGPGATAAFEPAGCADLARFAASAFIGTREVLHTSDLTPDADCLTQIELTRT